MRRSFARRDDDDETEVNLTPMLDVVFIMLIFFIVTATFVKEEGLDVNALLRRFRAQTVEHVAGRLRRRPPLVERKGALDEVGSGALPIRLAPSPNLQVRMLPLYIAPGRQRVLTGKISLKSPASHHSPRRAATCEVFGVRNGLSKREAKNAVNG